MSDGLNINGNNLDKFRNLKDVELAKEEFSNSKIFNIFDGGGVLHGDKKLDAKEISNIFDKLQAADKSGDGEVSMNELRNSEFVKELKNMYKGVKTADIMNFAKELMVKLGAASEAQEA